MSRLVENNSLEVTGSSVLLTGLVPERWSAGTRSSRTGPGPAALAAVSRISYSAPERVRLCAVTSVPSSTVSSSAAWAQRHASMRAHRV